MILWCDSSFSCPFPHVTFWYSFNHVEGSNNWDKQQHDQYVEIVGFLSLSQWDDPGMVDTSGKLVGENVLKFQENNRFGGGLSDEVVGVQRYVTKIAHTFFVIMTQDGTAHRLCVWTCAVLMLGVGIPNHCWSPSVVTGPEVEGGSSHRETERKGRRQRQRQRQRQRWWPSRRGEGQPTRQAKVNERQALKAWKSLNFHFQMEKYCIFFGRNRFSNCETWYWTVAFIGSFDCGILSNS